jgi:hypothetical protein
MMVAALAMTLGACGGEASKGYAGGYDASPEMATAAAPMAPAMEEYSRQEYQTPPAPGSGGAPANPDGGRLMSYRYAWQFSVPTENMSGLQAAHKKLCEDAGPANCYVTSSQLEGIGEGEGAYGSLSMRATETWMRTFEKGVGEGLKPFGASIYSTGRDSEDLTTQIVDHEARLRSMISHRDALQKMIDDKPGRLSDLLEIQKALAESQGNIDSSQSLIAALRLRVSMSVVDFSYRAELGAASNSMWRPITEAFDDFGPSFARTIAGLIQFVAIILPLVVIGGLVVWLGLTVFRWRGRKRAVRPPVSTVKSGS